MKRYDRSLVDDVDSSNMSPSRFIRLWTALALAMRHIHAHKIAHRDIKPDNILVDGDTFVLCDFDLAQHSNGLTTNMAGTVAYAAPELWYNQPIDPVPADIWSAGVTLLAVATTFQPWLKATPNDQMFASFLDSKDGQYVSDFLRRYVSSDFHTGTQHLVCTLVHMLHPRPHCRPSAAAIAMVSDSLCR
jgi:serine/threonine protein kinase